MDLVDVSVGDSAVGQQRPAGQAMGRSAGQGEVARLPGHGVSGV